jgi:hypothetical protein
MNDNPKLTITLTGRAPVTINKEEWPVVASAKWHDGREIESQSNRRRRVYVRQHEDGRAIVYGVFDSNWEGERDIRRGELLNKDADLPAAIHRVCEAIGGDERLAEECIADLPAVEI